MSVLRALGKASTTFVQCKKIMLSAPSQHRQLFSASPLLNHLCSFGTSGTKVDSSTICGKCSQSDNHCFCLTRASIKTSSLPSVWGSMRLIHTTAAKEVENGPDRMSYVKGILEQEGLDSFGVSPFARQAEEKLDIVHVKLIKNNTFVIITDSNGNKKVGASSGCLEEMKGGPKLSRYAAEATAEHVGRLGRSLGLKSVVMRVNGFTHFKKKKQAILSWREGFTYGRGDQNPIKFIEDTTRRPHNGCRLPKKRRI